MTDKNIDTLVADYIKIRDMKAQIVAEQKQVTDRISKVLKKIEGQLMDAMTELGTESMRTPSGTCYRVIQTSAKVEDRDQYLEFVKANGAWAFLESRANKTAVEEYLEANGELPPGITVTRFATVNVRRT